MSRTFKSMEVTGTAVTGSIERKIVQLADETNRVSSRLYICYSFLSSSFQAASRKRTFEHGCLRPTHR